MAGSGKEITNSIRKLIIFYRSSGKSVRNIAKLVNLSHSTVQYVIKRFKEGNRIENKLRKGRPSKLTQRGQRFKIRKTVKNLRLTRSMPSLFCLSFRLGHEITFPLHGL